MALDAYITAKVQQEVALLTNSQTAIVREIGNKAEDEVWTRMKRYSWVVGGVIILLGLYGFTSIRDAKKTIVDESLRRVEPVVKQVENRAQNAQSKLWEVEKQLPGVTESLNKTATLADEQRSRIEGQSSEVNSKLKEFQTAAKKADQLSTQFEASVNNSQKRLNELTKRYDNQLTQITQAITQQSVLEAFPMLGEEPFIQIQSARLDRIEKKPGDKWVNVYVTQDAMVKNIVTGQNLEQLVIQLRSLGFTPFLGYIFTHGRLNGILENAGHGNPNACQLYCVC